MELLEGRAAPGAQTGCLGRSVQIVLFLAVLAMAYAGQLAAWLAAALNSEAASPASVTALQAVVAGGVLLPFALFWRGRRERAIYRTWLLAALYLLLMAATRLLPPTQNALVLLLQLGVTLLFTLGLYIITSRQRRAVAGGAAPGLAWAAAALAGLPWVLYGALGSVEETVLSLLLGLAFGAAAALLLALFWLPSLAFDSRGRGSDILTGGLAAGAVLVTMASGLSLNGLQLALMFALPSLGFAAVALAYTSPAAPASAPPGEPGAGEPGAGDTVQGERSLQGFDWPAPALLLGLATAAALAFTDPGTMAVEMGDPALGWAWRAALYTALPGGLLALAVLLGRRRLGAIGRGPGAWGAAAALWVALAAVYWLGGRAGFYGDRLFVMLQSQADVAFAAEIEDYDVRRQTVYTTLVEHANGSQAGLRATLDGWRLAYTPYYLVNAVEVEGGLLAWLLLAGQADVDRILPSPRLRPLPGPLDPGQGTELPADHDWNLAQIGADRVWQELSARGAGIVIGQSDSGVDPTHSELADGYRGRAGDNDYAWFDPWSHTAVPVDYGGHGTHTLATVAGNTTGVAPDAQWIACANLQRNLGNPALYLDCLQFMLAPFPVGGDPLADGAPLRSAHVLNNSWGCPQEHEGCDPTSLQAAVAALRAAGIFVVASAGNAGPACSTIADPIALYADTFTVGAVDAASNLATFSSAGPVTADGSGRTKPDIAAPGVAVWSAYPGGEYAEMSGTSMAGPHVAGVVALMWSANPQLIGDIARTEQILRQTARPFSGQMESGAAAAAEDAGVALPAAPDAPVQVASGACILNDGAGERPNNLVGYGVVDAYAAVQRALSLPD